MTARTGADGRRLDDLLRRYRATRSADVLGDAFDLAAPALFRLALAWTPDAATAEDALQETFLAAFERIDTWEDGRPAAPWLAGILRHKCAKLRRRSRRDPAPLEVPLASADEGPVQSAHRREETERVREALARLPEPYRSVGLLRWRHGLTPAEIAEVRGEPPGTVRSTLTRALRRLRRDLGSLSVVALGWWRAPRGLRAVRAEIVRATRGAQPASAALTFPAALAVGGLLMIAKKHVVVAAALAALLVAVANPPTCATRSDVRSTATAAAPGVRARALAPEIGTAATFLPSDPPAASGPILRGVVLDRGRSPLAGARVAVFPSGVEEAVAPDALPGVTTGADGRFEVDGGAGDAAYVVVARAEGFAPRTRTGVRPPGDVTIVLGAPASFEGRVLGPDDAPVAGARVRVSGVLTGGARFDAQSTSGEDGSYRVSGLPPIERRSTSPDGRIEIEVRMDGFAPLFVADVLAVGVQAVPDLAEGRTTRFDLHLVRGAVISGRALDASGSPVAGARVALMSYEHAVWLDRFVDPLRWLGNTTTAADGSFRFAAVPASGVHRPAILGELLPFGALVAVGPDGGLGVVAIPILRDGESRTVDLAISPVAWVTGRVVEESGAAVAGAGVGLRTERGRPLDATFRRIPDMEVPCPFATTDADGRFRAAVPLTADAGTRLFVDAKSRAVGMLPFRSGEIDVSLETRDVGDVTIRAAPPGFHADVTVVDASGRPVAGAIFRNREALHIPDAAWGWPTTDAEGRSRLSWSRRSPEDIPAGPTPREVVVTAPGFAPTVADVVFDANVRESQRIALAAGSHVAGRVAWSDGRSANDAWVFVLDAAAPLDEALPSGRTAREPPDRHPSVRGLVLLGRVHAEADGTFRADDLPDGTYNVVARADSRAPDGARIEVARAALPSVRAGAEDLSLVLPLRDDSDTPKSAAFDVRVLDEATGRPLAGARADLFDGKTIILSSEPVSEGLARFPSVPQGTWILRASAPRFGQTVRTGVRVGDGGAPLEVRVPRGATVHGCVAGAGEGLVHLESEDGSVPQFWLPSTPLARDGTFAIEGVAAGRYRVLAPVSTKPVAWAPCADVLEIRAGDADVQFESRVQR